MPEYKQGQIVDALSERISAGVYREKLPSTTVLAEEFKVNIRTLNKALSQLVQKGLVEKRRGIGTFVRSAEQRKLSILVRYYGIGEMYESSYYVGIWQGLSSVAAVNGCKLEVIKTNPDKVSGCDGVIFVGHTNYDCYRQLQKDKIPFVVIENLSDPEVCTVCADSKSALYSALCKILESGRSRIAYIGMTTSRSLKTDVEKFHTYLEAVDDVLHDIDFSLVKHAWPLPENGYEKMKELLEDTVPDAVLVTSDLMAAGVYRAVRERGLSVPDDVCVIGHDGLDIPLNPTLATVKVPRFQLGAKSLEMLLEQIREPGRRKVKKITLPTEFISGASLPLIK